LSKRHHCGGDLTIRTPDLFPADARLFNLRYPITQPAAIHRSSPLNDGGRRANPVRALNNFFSSIGAGIELFAPLFNQAAPNIGAANQLDDRKREGPHTAVDQGDAL
jgi:hypothetical protein